MIECSNLNSRIVSSGEKGVARTQAGTDCAQAFIALLLQPVKAAANVENGLSAGVHGAADVRGNRIVGAANFRGAANIVVRHAQPQHRNSDAGAAPPRSFLSQETSARLPDYFPDKAYVPEK